MNVEEMIKHTNLGMSKDKLCLSKIGETALRDKWKKKPDQGGFSNYWKETAFEDVPREFQWN
jgi:hypothetical protein